MPTRSRGKQPNDDQLFAPRWHPILKEAVDDCCWLLNRGYAPNSITQMVGNRYKLNKRQRDAVRRISASDQEIATRQAGRVEPADVKGQAVEIDGFNLLILLESALSGGYILRARDGTFRDLSSVHGSYKRVRQTEEAILLVGNTLRQLGAASVKWYFDQPVSNSGRLKTSLREISDAHQFDWKIELVFDPDKVLAQSQAIVISSDGWIIEQGIKWLNLGAILFEAQLKDLNLIAV